jgi:hypothetical protein
MALVMVLFAVLFRYEDQASIIYLLFLFGHTVAACAIANGRLSFDRPIRWRWVEIITVFAAPWVGPLAWYLEWKKTSREPVLLEINAKQWTTCRVRFIVLVCLVMAFVALAIFCR